MKRISELTLEEKANLDNEEIQKFIDAECLFNNKPLLPTKPTEPEFNHERDFIGFSVNGLILKDRETAYEYISFINSKQLYKENYDYPLPYEIKYAEVSAADLSITEVNLFSQTEYKRLNGNLKIYKEKLECYEASKRIYNEIHKQVQEIETFVLGEVSYAKQRLKREEDNFIMFKRYCSVYDDIETAKQKIKDTYFSEETANDSDLYTDFIKYFSQNSDFVYDKIEDVIDNFEEDCDCGSDGHNSECFVNN